MPLLILAGIGLSLRSVVDLAISTPVSLEGLVVMVLLAYTIFTTTLVLQRKQAARGLALGLASLTIPLVPLLALSRLIVEAIFIAALGLLLFRGLLRPEVRDLSERAMKVATPRTAARARSGPGRYPHRARDVARAISARPTRPRPAHRRTDTEAIT